MHINNMKYKTLGFALFRKCNANCEVCCFESSPSCKERLDKNLIKEYIDSAVGDEKLQNISFTGGEPFLEYNLLLELTEYATEKGFNVNLITNCFWANTKEIAIERLAALKKKGLKRMNVSFDEFHNEYVSEKNVINVVEACKKLSIPVVVGMIKKRDTNIGEVLNKLDDGLLNVGLMVYPVLPVGGAAKNLKAEDFIKYKLEDISLKCQYDGNIVVRYDGKIHPCCNQCVVDTELIVGDYAEEGYSDTLRTIKNNGILYILRNFGLAPFVSYAKDELHMQLPEYVTSACELCGLFFSKENIDKFYPMVKQCIRKLQEGKHEKDKLLVI